MFKKKSIILLMIIIIIIPSFAKKKKTDVSTLMRDRKPNKETMTTTSILKKDRTLAINYIKVRNRIYLTKKRRKFKLIFKASIKHILEERGNGIIYKPPVKGNHIFEFNSAIEGSIFRLTPFNYKKGDINSELGIINSNFNKIDKTILFLSGNIKRGRFNADFEFGKDINKNGRGFINTQLFFEFAEGLKTQISLSNGERLLSPEYGLLKREKFKQDELFETFSLIKKIHNYELKILQNYAKIGFSSFNMYEFSFMKNDDELTGFLAGGYIFNSKDINDNSLYIKMGLIKKIGISKIGVEYPLLFNRENNSTYFSRLYYKFIPKIMLNTYLPFLESEIFLDFYIKKDRVLYIWGIRKFSL
jgi:hypothetical protein